MYQGQPLQIDPPGASAPPRPGGDVLNQTFCGQPFSPSFEESELRYLLSSTASVIDTHVPRCLAANADCVVPWAEKDRDRRTDDASGSSSNFRNRVRIASIRFLQSLFSFRIFQRQSFLGLNISFVFLGPPVTSSSDISWLLLCVQRSVLVLHF